MGGKHINKNNCYGGEKCRQDKKLVKYCSNSSYAFPLLIAKIQHIDEDAIILDSYINCICNDSFFDIYEQDYYLQKKGVFDVERKRVYSYKILLKFENFMAWLDSYFKDGYIVSLHLDQYHMSQSEFYNMKHTDSGCLLKSISSYESSYNVIVPSFTGLANISVSVDELQKSILGTGKESFVLEFIKLRKVPIFNRNEFLFDIIDYLNSSNRKNHFNKNNEFGITACLNYINNVRSGKRSKKSGNFFSTQKSLSVFLDQKQMMKNRIRTLIEKQELCAEFYSYLEVLDKFDNLICYECVVIDGNNSFKLDKQMNLLEKITFEEKEVLGKLVKKEFDQGE